MATAKPAGRKPHFIVPFQPDSSSEHLEIPGKFNQHIEGSLNVWTLLSGRGGKVWHVGLVKLHDTFFFNEGWSGFVRDNFLEAGDTLVFGYNGNWRFEVYAFEESGCEKECGRWGGRTETIFGKKRGRDEDVDDVCKACGHPEKKRTTDVCRNHVGCTAEGTNGLLEKHCEEREGSLEALQLVVFDETGPLNESSEIHKSSDDPAMRSQQRYRPEQPGGPNKFRDSTHRHTLQGKGSKLKFSALEEKVSRSFKSDFPHFVRVMKNFNVSGSYTLKIPHRFSREHLPRCKTRVVLQTSEIGRWTVNSVPTFKVHTSHTFCGGWLAFVRANNITVGDACIFELISDCVMHVHILKEGKGKASCNGGKRSKFRSLVSVISDNQRLSSGSKNLGPETWFRKAENIGGDKVNSQTRNSMSAEEERVARSFASSFPYFVRIMKKFNVSGSFTVKIPYQFSTVHLPGCKTELVLRNAKGELWTVNSVPAANRPTMHTLCGGWMAFVRCNNIQLGDILIFELVGPSQLIVHVSRSVDIEIATCT